MTDTSSPGSGAEAPSSHNTAPGRPTRISIHDRFAQADRRVEKRAEQQGEAADATESERAAQREAPSLLADTSLTALSGLSVLTDSFRIDEGGRAARDDSGAPISAPLTRLEDPHPLEVDSAREHHVLLLSPEVDPEELEALAISVWDDAGWAGAGNLTLCQSARLNGPWSVDAATRAELGSGADLTRAWILNCPASRGKAPDEDMKERDRWARAFPDGMPIGLEYKVLLVLYRMARRLGGALRIATDTSGDVIQPDPDSAVGLTLYSRRWLDPDELMELLHRDFPTVVDSRELGVRQQRRLTQREVEAARAIQSSTPALREDIAQRLKRDRAEAATRDQVLDGYCLVAPAGNRSEFSCEVTVTRDIPRVLRWEIWESQSVICYRLHWLNHADLKVHAPTNMLTRTARLERARSARDIERAAGLIVSAVGGFVVDEDDFLVAMSDQDS